jgi:hypothetical protein
MKDPATNRKYLAILAFLGLCGLMLFQPAPHWGGSIQISTVRIAVSLSDDAVRFRTQVSGSEHPILSMQLGSERS